MKFILLEKEVEDREKDNAKWWLSARVVGPVHVHLFVFSQNWWICRLLILHSEVCACNAFLYLFPFCPFAITMTSLFILQQFYHHSTFTYCYLCPPPYLLITPTNHQPCMHTFIYEPDDAVKIYVYDLDGPQHDSEDQPQPHKFLYASHTFFLTANFIKQHNPCSMWAETGATENTNERRYI